MGPFTEQMNTDPNPAGFFENHKLTAFHSRFTGSSAKEHWGNLKDSYDLNDSWMETYRAVVHSLEDKSDGLWGFKDLRVYSFCNEFLSVCRSNIKIVEIVRSSDHVIRSMRLYPDVGGLDIYEVYERWVSLKNRALSARYFGRFPHFAIQYEDLIDNQETGVGQIANFIGMPVTDEAVDFIDPRLNRSGA